MGKSYSLGVTLIEKIEVNLAGSSIIRWEVLSKRWGEVLFFALVPLTYSLSQRPNLSRKRKV